MTTYLYNLSDVVTSVGRICLENTASLTPEVIHMKTRRMERYCTQPHLITCSRGCLALISEL